EKAGLKVPAGTKMIIVELAGTGKEHPLSLEKLSPVLAMVKSNSHAEAFKLAEQMLETGLGHTACIHTEDEDLQIAYALKMKACRILVNTPTSQGGIGDIYNEMIPSLTLGCGSYGKNSISQNVTTV
ncbi:bifunctional acetaldehyde-CoA/alcohol dehydrogenase, partial [Salmonella enterica subsp. enterica serovar Lubbock]|nr:bifunctional acetaldehyde-CoA/alcohol dehydrogenase [Salmonella enterica subsp. enterica serovar Lubbock]